ncbi:MAG: GNAT family N-acetyltransferase [Parahaliea sp.]
MEIFKKTLRFLLGEYSVYFIYASPDGKKNDALVAENPAVIVKMVNPSELLQCESLQLQNQSGYMGDESIAYGCWLNNDLVAVCFYWFGRRYATRNFWPLKQQEAKLVQIICSEKSRGQGAATALITASTRELTSVSGNGGFARLYARIWHSNTPSVRAFEKSGWRRIATILEINPLRRKRPLRIKFK